MNQLVQKIDSDLGSFATISLDNYKDLTKVTWKGNLTGVGLDII